MRTDIENKSAQPTAADKEQARPDAPAKPGWVSPGSFADTGTLAPTPAADDAWYTMPREDWDPSAGGR